MPFDTLAQMKGQPDTVLVPRPIGGKVGHDRAEVVLRDVLVEYDEVIEHPHHRPFGHNRCLLVDRRARWAVDDVFFENPAGLLRNRRVDCGHHS
jgi:hypothetical protein